MGYNSKLIIVSKTDMGHTYNDGYYYAQVIATYDLAKFPLIRDIFSRDTDCYFYADDGNTTIISDMYGDNMKEANISDIIAFIDGLSVEDFKYRRIQPLLNLLRGFRDLEKSGKFKDLVVLHYGY